MAAGCCSLIIYNIACITCSLVFACPTLEILVQASSVFLSYVVNVALVTIIVYIVPSGVCTLFV